MNFLEQMSRLRREYRTEASRLDKRLDELSERTDSGFTRFGQQLRLTQDQLRLTQEQVRRLQDQIVAVHDQLGAAVESIETVKADHKETTRTMQGRARLLEDRFGKMLDLVEQAVEEAPTRVDLEDLTRRVEALEKKIDPAA